MVIEKFPVKISFIRSEKRAGCMNDRDLTYRKGFTLKKVFHYLILLISVYDYPIAWRKSSIRSSISSIPTLNRINASVIPMRSLSSFGTEA
jgi:hypothetical protein